MCCRDKWGWRILSLTATDHFRGPTEMMVNRLEIEAFKSPGQPGREGDNMGKKLEVILEKLRAVLEG